MALSKIPDSALDKLRCRCGRYLSSAPISVCRDGQSLCSSCVDTRAPRLGALARNVSYETVASFFEFPCRYKPQGCAKYIEFNKLTDHEGECTYRTYQCPASFLLSCNKSGTTAQLCQHYERDHPELFLKQSHFTINVNTDFESCRLFKVDDVVLLLQSKCSPSQEKIWFSTVYFGNANNASLLQYNIKLSSNENKKRIMELEKETTRPVSNTQMLPSQSIEVAIPVVMAFLKQPELIQCHWIIAVPEELKNKVKNQHQSEQQETFKIKKESLKCPNCGVYMVPPIFCCAKNHKTCADCKGYNNYCGGCQKINIVFSQIDNLERLARYGKHHCRWVRCSAQYSYDSIRLHEQGCSYRVYKCPECNSWSGIYDELLSHFKSVHSDFNIYLTSSVPLNGLNQNYVIIQRELFKVTHKHNHNSNNAAYAYGGQKNITFPIKVYYLGSPSCATYWKYQIRDSRNNRIYDWTSVNCNQYTFSGSNQNTFFSGYHYLHFTKAAEPEAPFRRDDWDIRGNYDCRSRDA